MNEPSVPMPAAASPTRSYLNPSAPLGARVFRPRDIAYVVEGPNSSTHGRTSKRWVVTSGTWLRGWDVNKRVRLVTATHAVEVVIKGIMDFGTATRNGVVPNVRLPHWKVEDGS